MISQTLEQERRQRELLEQHYAQYDADDDEVGSPCRFLLATFLLARFLLCTALFFYNSMTDSLQFPKENVAAVILTGKKYYLNLLFIYESSNGILFTV